ncbi:class I SAM-dependent DNA methyltransferase [Flavobacterium sp. TSSA_36]|uniref:class I SAM-dependent DNA methyltransferase n=1 Tax=Flavobacterium sp. TSSA_36 TaxID=3447669 RepID=UPI003F2D6BA3
MANLYKDKMAVIYDQMYQTFIDYDEEYHFYNQILGRHHCQSVLELGSGAGNLALRFFKNNQSYIGLDASEDMIAIAQKRTSKSTFIHGDMREFVLDAPVDSILITGRSTSYLISNEDIYYCFDSVYQNLNPDGLFIFDCIDANRYIPYTEKNTSIIHQADCEGTTFYRESNWKITTADNFLMEWTAKYYQMQDNEKEIIAEDFSTVRVFTLNEIELYLNLKGFEILETIDRPTYAYDTFVIIAQKKKINLND